MTVEDDGQGIDTDKLRAQIVERGLTDADTAGQLSEAELKEFMFLPGFSTASEVTELSGRGVGLDIVQNMVESLGGSVRVTTLKGLGTRIEIKQRWNLRRCARNWRIGNGGCTR